MAMNGITYCSKQQLDAWKCQDCGRLKLFGHYEAPTKDSTQVVVVGDKAKNAIIVGFRGTLTTPEQWASDLKFALVNWPGKNCPGGCTVHLGFNNVFGQIRDKTIEIIRKAVKEWPTADIFVTGHSLGAAIATMMSMWLHTNVPELTPTQL